MEQVLDFVPHGAFGGLGFNVVEVCLLRLCLRFIAGQQLSRGISLCGTMIFVARRFGFSMWLMVWLAASNFPLYL